MTRAVRAEGEKPLHWAGSARHDVRLIEARLKAAREDYEERYG